MPQLRANDEHNAIKPYIYPSLQITSQRQIIADIQTQSLQPGSYIKEFQTTAYVADLTGLLTFKKKYQIAESKVRASQALLQKERQNLKRITKLHGKDASSQKRFQEQYSLTLAAQAQYDAEYAQQQYLDNKIKLLLGNTLTKALLSPDDSLFKSLLQGEQTLLKVIIPSNRELPKHITNVAINKNNERTHAINAKFLSSSLSVSKNNQGDVHYFISPNFFPFGSRLIAWVKEEQIAKSGFYIPEQAIVRHMGETFIYLKTDEQHFRRVLLNNPMPADSGYFTSTKLPHSTDLVTQGTQLLLAEEFRALIPKEDDDDDDDDDD